MADTPGSISLVQLAEVLAVVGPVAGGVWVLFKSVYAIVAAAVKSEADARDDLETALTRSLGLLEARTTTIERDGATRKDLDAAEGRIKNDIHDVKGDVRDLRSSSQNILTQLGALGAMLGRHPPAGGVFPAERG